MTARWTILFAFAYLIVSPGSLHAQEPAISAFDLTRLWEQFSEQPEDVAVGCVPLANPGDAVLYNADEPFPLASVTKLLMYIEYARRVNAGQIRTDEMVDVEVLDRYNLPRTDRGAHDRFMSQYPDDVAQISLWDLALGMVSYSSNAASDYLLDRLGPVDWEALYWSLGVTHTDAPHSLTMIPLLMNNHETGKATVRDLESLSREQGEDYLVRYIDDEVWREAEIRYRSGRGSQFPSWSVQTAFLEQHTARGTINDFLSVLRSVYTDESWLSANVRSMTRNALRWTENEFINEWYAEYGSKLGFYSGGTLTLIAYGQPVDGEPVISAIFLRDVERRAYSEMLEEDTLGDFVHWLNFNGCQGLQAALPAA
ncbi:MAG: serine hydrolase [Chloroflexi bacterium]|nr:serine hydrolase [Chloroflexota bacterium]